MVNVCNRKGEKRKDQTGIWTPTPRISSQVLYKLNYLATRDQTRLCHIPYSQRSSHPEDINPWSLSPARHFHLPAKGAGVKYKCNRNVRREENVVVRGIWTVDISLGSSVGRAPDWWFGGPGFKSWSGPFSSRYVCMSWLIFGLYEKLANIFQDPVEWR